MVFTYLELNCTVYLWKVTIVNKYVSNSRMLKNLRIRKALGIFNFLILLSSLEKNPSIQGSFGHFQFFDITFFIGKKPLYSRNILVSFKKV